MKRLIIILSFLLPVSLSAQLLRSYGVVEIGSTFPTSTSTGAKFAYRTTDSSYYRWVSGNTWVKIIEPSIIPDTLYLTEEIGTSYKVSGDTINLTPYLLKSDTTSMLVKYIERGDTLGMLSAYIRSAGWGLLKSSYTLRADSSLLATKLYTNRFLLKSDTATFLAPYIDGFGTTTRIPIFTGSRTIGDSPIAYNSTTKRTTWDSPGVIELPMGTDAQRPSPATTSDFWYNTTGNGIEWYNGTRWAKGLESTANRFASGIIPYADANGQMKGSYSDMYFAATELVVYRAPYFSSNQVGIAGGIRVYNTNTTSAAGYGSIALYPSTGGKYAQFFCTNTLYPGYGVITAQSFGHYANGPGGMGVQSDDPTSSIRFGIGTTGTIEKMRLNASALGLFTSTPTQELDVNGDLRVRDSTQLPITSSILQTEASGWVKALTIGSGLSYSGGTLSSTGTWLKTELEAGRDVDITGVSSTDFRVRNTRIQLDNRLKVGTDSSFLYDPVTKNLQITGTEELRGNSGILYLGAYGASPPDASVLNTGYIFNTNTRFGIFSGAGASVNDDILFHATATRKVSIRAINDTIPGIGISLSKATFIRQRLIIAPDSTFKFDPTTDVLQLSQYGTGTKEATDLSKTQSNYIAGFATDGTVLDLGLGSGLSVSGGLLTSANIGNSNLTLTGNRTLSGAFTLDLDPTTVRLYGRYNLPDETPSTTKSTAIGFFNGFPAMIQLARDTFIQDVTLFSVGTLMQSCQELTVVSSMTNLAPTHQEIRFPDAAEEYRGKKIIVFSRRKDASIYVPQIKVVGGVSRLYFTTTPGIGGADPSDQSILSLDDVTWPEIGTYEFTCLKINSTDYRWVLKQR